MFLVVFLCSSMAVWTTVMCFWCYRRRLFCFSGKWTFGKQDKQQKREAEPELSSHRNKQSMQKTPATEKSPGHAPVKPRTKKSSFIVDNQKGLSRTAKSPDDSITISFVSQV
jgi:hypothetical protein